MEKNNQKIPMENIDEKETPVIGFKKIIAMIIRGFIALLPIIIVIFVITFLFGFILSIIQPISFILATSNEPHWSLHILSFILLLLIIYIAGVIVTNRYGRMYFRSFEKTYLAQIPLYNTLREMVAQFSGQKEIPFQQVVLVDIFNTGTLMTGFVTQEVNEEICSIYVPTAPNPANGNIYHIPRSRLTYLAVAPEDAMRTVIGMGTGSNVLFENVVDAKSLPSVYDETIDDLDK